MTLGVLLCNSTDPPATAQGEGADIVKQITDALFTSGAGRPVRRLVLDLENGRNGGGYCRAAVERIVRAAIAERDKPLVSLLRQIEQHCPCGARPESLNSHPHVPGCPVADALVMLGER